MARLYLADAYPEERTAFRLLIRDLRMDLVGEASDWPTVLVQVPRNRAQMVVVDWDLLPASPAAALDGLRKVCPFPLVVVLLSHLDPRSKTALSVFAEVFISKNEMSERVVERFRAVVKRFNM